MDDFKNIYKEYRPIPFWSWNERLECEETIRQCELMNNAGMGGYFMHARGGLQTEYMGEEWFSNVEAAIESAEATGMDAWIYDENGWPSGFGNGIVNSLGEKYQQKYLRMEKGEKDTANTICNANGFHFYYEVNPFYVDNLNKAVVAEFIDKIYNPYYEKYANRIKGVFTDEPQLSRVGIPWSDVLPDEYKLRYKREIYPDLIMLFENTGDYKRIRIDFYKLITDLFCESYTEQIYQWCCKMGWEFTGHMAEEDTLKSQLTTNGAVMPHYEYFTIPGVDWLTRNISDGMIARQLGSVAQQLGKRKVLTESFACCGHNVSFDELKRIMDWQMVRGATICCPHLEGYSLRGIRKRDYPPAMYYQQPWWSEYKQFIDEISRVGMILENGRAECDTLLIHPQTTAWTMYNTKENAGLDSLQNDFVNAVEELEKKHILFHLGDETIIERHGRVEGNNFIVGNQCYSQIVVLEGQYFLDSTKVLLKKFCDNDGIIASVKEIDENDITDNPEITYTKRVFDNYIVHYFVNSTDKEQQVHISSGSKLINQRTGELEDMAHLQVMRPYSSIMVYDDGTDVQCNQEQRAVLKPEGVWKVVSSRENVVTLDTCDVYFDGELKEKNCYVLSVQNMACEYERVVDVRCVFRRKIGYIPDNLQLICETPEKFDIYVNGKRIKNEETGYFIDKSFKRINISEYAVKGENTIELVCKFEQSEEVYENIRKAKEFETEKNKLTFDVEIEPIYLIGDFGVYTDNKPEYIERSAFRVQGDFQIAKRKDEINLSHIEQQGYLFFAGELSIQKEIEINETDCDFMLNKQGINAIRITVNDRYVDTLLYSGEKVNLSDYLIKGKNIIKLTLINNLRNMLGPHHLQEGECYAVGPHSFYKDACVWNNGNPVEWNAKYCFVEMSIK